MSEWKNVPENINEYFGFVYKITKLNAVDDEKYYYIGCKQLQKKVTKKPLKDKKRKRIEYKESDWKNYWGSSKELLAEIETYGEENFSREILHLCESKYDMKLLECIEQFKHNVLLDDRAWNGIINIRLGKIPKGLLHKKDKYLM